MERDRADATYEGHTYTAECCAVTRDGLYALSGGGDNTVRLWSLAEQVAPTRPDRHAQLVYGCTIDDDATLACSAPQDDVPAVWAAREGTRLRALPTSVAYGHVRFCRFGGRSCIAALGNGLRVYDPETAEYVDKLAAANEAVTRTVGRTQGDGKGGTTVSPNLTDRRVIRLDRGERP